MNRLAIVAALATWLAVVGSAGAGHPGTPALGDTATEAAGLGQGGSGAAALVTRDRMGYGGYADAETAGQAYYGWRYPFAPPLAAALAATEAGEKSKPK